MAIILVFDDKMACIGWEGQNPFPTGEKGVLKSWKDRLIAGSYVAIRQRLLFGG